MKPKKIVNSEVIKEELAILADEINPLSEQEQFFAELAELDQPWEEFDQPVWLKDSTQYLEA